MFQTTQQTSQSNNELELQMENNYNLRLFGGILSGVPCCITPFMKLKK